MEEQWLPKRRRVVTTCTECQRRKQKCDRARPCNNCLARDVPEKCFYTSQPSPPEHKHRPQQSDAATESKDHAAFDTLQHVQREHYDLTDQLGYTSNHDNNLITGLQGLILGIEGQQKPPRKLGPVMTPTSKAKYLDVINQLPSRKIQVTLVESYFSDANWYFAVLEKYYFMRAHDDWLAVADNVLKGIFDDLTRELQHFSALLFQVLATSLRFQRLDTPVCAALGLDSFEDIDILSEKYSNAGIDVIHILGRHHSTMSSVQHNLMRSLWLKNSSRGIESWYGLCDAVRDAQDIGLHRQCPMFEADAHSLEEALAQLWYDEYKRRLWATLFSWDGHMALMLGRPRTIHVKDCTVKAPTDCDIPEDPTRIFPTTPTAQDEPSSYSAAIFRYSLAHTVHDMISQEANTSGMKNYNIVGNLHNQVISLLEALPPVARMTNPDCSWDFSHPHLPKHRLHISISANSFLMSLHRPHVRIHNASCQAAVKAALDLLQSQASLSDLLGAKFYRIYSMAFFTIDAGIFLCSIVQHLMAETRVLQDIHSSLRSAIFRLDIIKDVNPMARTGAHVLKACYHQICSAHLLVPSPNPPVDPIRSVQYQNQAPHGGIKKRTWDGDGFLELHEQSRSSVKQNTGTHSSNIVENLRPSPTMDHTFNDIDEGLILPPWTNYQKTAQQEELGSAQEAIVFNTPWGPQNTDQELAIEPQAQLEEPYSIPWSWTSLDEFVELDPGTPLSESIWSSLIG